MDLDSRANRTKCPNPRPYGVRDGCDDDDASVDREVVGNVDVLSVLDLVRLGPLPEQSDLSQGCDLVDDHGTEDDRPEHRTSESLGEKDERPLGDVSLGLLLLEDAEQTID